MLTSILQYIQEYGIFIIRIHNFLMILFASLGAWRVFEKMGIPGWKAVVPFYARYTLFRILWERKYYFISLFLIFAGFILTLLPIAYPDIPFLHCKLVGYALMLIGYNTNYMMFYEMAEAFGRKAAFAIGLLLFPEIFLMILGFNPHLRYRPKF